MSLQKAFRCLTDVCIIFVSKINILLEEGWEEDGLYYSRGTVGEWTVEWSDPRLPPKMWHRIDFEGYGGDEPDGGVTPYATSVLLQGDDGSWAGTGRGVGYDDGFVQTVLVGEGAYEGLYAILDRTDSILPDGSAHRDFVGFIFGGIFHDISQSF